MKPPEESINRRPAILAAHHSGGVTKNSKSGRKAVLSSKARRRHEKGMDRAEAIMERTAKKLQKSKGQARTLHERRKTWDEINSGIPDHAKGAKPTARKPAQLGEGDDDEGGSFVDTDEEMDVPDGASMPQEAPPAPQSVPLPPALEDDEDEIL